MCVLLSLVAVDDESQSGEEGRGDPSIGGEGEERRTMTLMHARALQRDTRLTDERTGVGGGGRERKEGGETTSEVQTKRRRRREERRGEAH